MEFERKHLLLHTEVCGCNAVGHLLHLTDIGRLPNSWPYFLCYHCTYFSNHLQQFFGNIFHYFFDEDVSEFDWIRNRFECDLTHLTGREQEQLADLSSDKTLRMKFNRLPQMSFELACLEKYSLLQDKAIVVQIPFSKSYCAKLDFLL
ncbi:hypothetical protein RF11_08476 [Thelohanellus kitauei]|uniref:Uncharacterized protein n=1 Tax=Thelohanellus kitauei TaxID=669202 RepID=A0A0C2MQM4_THEKT|nr:hypothetical protein RF11_08476 [Thelohanellus kitauei]